MTDHIPARTAWGEARGAGSEAMQAVLCVIRNRVVDGGWWGDTYESVCLHPEQFSCWNGTDPNRAKLEAVTSADPQFAEALAMEARLLGTGAPLPDITNGADSYYAVRSPMPSWARRYRRTAVIGGQAFFQTRSLTAPMRATMPPRVSKMAALAERWAMAPTTIQGAGVVATAVVAAALHQLTWLHAVPGFVLGSVWMALPQKDAALRKPLAAVVEDAVLAIVTGQVSQAVAAGDVQALIAALRGLAAPPDDPNEMPPTNEPFGLPALVPEPPAPAVTVGVSGAASVAA